MFIRNPFWCECVLSYITYVPTNNIKAQPNGLLLWETKYHMAIFLVIILLKHNAHGWLFTLQLIKLRQTSIGQGICISLMKANMQINRRSGASSCDCNIKCTSSEEHLPEAQRMSCPVSAEEELSLSDTSASPPLYPTPPGPVPPWLWPPSNSENTRLYVNGTLVFAFDQMFKWAWRTFKSLMNTFGVEQIQVFTELYLHMLVFYTLHFKINLLFSV